MNLIYEAAALRDELHEMPELGMATEKTHDYVVAKLEALGIETHAHFGGTNGVVGYIRGEEAGPTLMIRADMDALPFVIDGQPCARHACGHDGHTATLLAAASRLTGAVRKGTLKLVFQPGEETLEGAQALIAAGVMDDVDYVLGAHVRPVQDIQLGEMCPAVKHGASCTCFVKVEGASAHAARPHLGHNAIDTGCAIVQAVQAIWLNPNESWSAKCTQFHADEGATNSIPSKAALTFDCRSQTNVGMESYLAQLKAAAEYTALAHGAKATVEKGLSCPAAEYDQDFVDIVSEAIVSVVGEENLAAPCGGGGEDFHYYKLAKPSVKAAYMGVGVGVTPGLHNVNMGFESKHLNMGVDVFVEIAKKLLG